MLLEELGSGFERSPRPIHIDNGIVLELDERLIPHTEMLQQHDQRTVEEHPDGARGRRGDIQCERCVRLEFGL